MKRVLIAGANIYNANKGVAALAAASIFLLYDLLSKVAGDFEICLYNHEFKKERDALLLPDGRTILFRNIYPTDIFSLGAFFKTIFSKSKLYYLKEFLKCGYVFNIAAGDGFSDIYGKSVFLAVTRVNKLCRLFHKPYYMLPQTFGPFYSSSSFELAKKECLSAGLIMSRDKSSAEFLRDCLGCNNVVDTIDVAFSLPYKELKKDPGYIHIGINISETLCFKHNGHMFGVSNEYLPVMKDVVRNLLSEGYKVHLIPHVANTNNSPGNEYYIQYRLWDEIQHPNLVLPPFFLTASDAKSYISSMDLFVGSRMHACIAAFSSGVPVLLLGYSRKFSGLFCDTLNYPYLIDVADGFSADSVENKIQSMISHLDDIKALIMERNLSVVTEKTTLLCNALSEILQ